MVLPSYRGISAQFSSMIPYGTLELLRHFYPSHGYLPTILHVGWHSRAELMNSELVMTLGLGLTIFMVLCWPRSKINGPVTVCCTITIGEYP